MPWCRTGVSPSLALVDATERIIRECNPHFWVIENVRGATRYLRKRYGEPMRLGPVCLWGVFPDFHARVPFWKEKLSSTQKIRRAAIPFQIGDGLRQAIESNLFWCRKDL